MQLHMQCQQQTMCKASYGRHGKMHMLASSLFATDAHLPFEPGLSVYGCKQLCILVPTCSHTARTSSGTHIELHCVSSRAEQQCFKQSNTVAGVLGPSTCYVPSVTGVELLQRTIQSLIAFIKVPTTIVFLSDLLERVKSTSQIAGPLFMANDLTDIPYQSTCS